MSLQQGKIEKASRKVRKFLKKNSKRPLPEQVHRLRTSIRRIEAALDALSPKLGHAERKLLGKIVKLRKLAGKIRDMDVLTANAVSVDASEKENLIALLNYLGAERHKQIKRLRSLVRDDGSSISQGTKCLSKNLEQLMSSKKRRPAKKASAEAVQLLSDLKDPATLNSQNLHPYRIKVKKLRDVIRLSDQKRSNGLAEALGEVKDAIGDWHDWVQLLSIGNKVLEGSSGSLIGEIKETTQTKYRRALSAAQSLRRQYIFARNHQLSAEALHAISTIAT